MMFTLSRIIERLPMTIQTPNKHASYFRFLIPIGIFFVGIILSSIVVLFAVTQSTSGMHQVTVPSTAYMEFKEAGANNIYHEYIAEGSTDLLKAQKKITEYINVTIKNTTTSEDLPLSQASYSSTYSSGNKHGELIYKVVIPSKGNYEVITSLDGAYPGKSATLKIGSGMGKKIAINIGISMLITLATLIIATISWIRVYKQVVKPKENLEAINPYEKTTN